MTISGAQNGNFAQSSNCGSSLAAGNSCTISVTFNPSQTGQQSATLQVSDNAAGSPQGVSLSGTGTSSGGGSVATPTFNPSAGAYSSAQSVTISTTTAGATLCYTTDGSTPTANGAGTCTQGTTYSSPVNVATSETLKALGSKSGYSDSSVGSAAYTITTNTVDVTVTVNGATEYQTLDGFGQAEPSTLGPWPSGPNISDSLRATAVEKAYGEVGLNMGIIGALLESPGDYSQRANDNSDAFLINWSGFNTIYLNNAKQYVVNLAKPYGFNNYYLGAEAPNVRWASPWLNAIRDSNYSDFLDEAAEQIEANMTWWNNTYGETLPFYQLGNEQASGNHASTSDGSYYGTVPITQQMVDLAKRAGPRLANSGFPNTKFIVGIEETEQDSLSMASAILSDPAAAPYVGGIGYHAYPYGSGYSSASYILSTSGAGKPDSALVAVRNNIRDLAAQHNIQHIWMAENSHSGAATLDYSDFRARAIQIHDEFLYANASAYFAEGAIWDLISLQNHSGSTDLYGADDEGNAVLVDENTGAVDITGIGYAIGHYARWIKPGAKRVDVTTSDPLVQVTTFRDDGRSRLTLVVINNNSSSKSVGVNVAGLSLSGNVTGEQSTSTAYWQTLPAGASGTNGFTITVPALSVTTVVTTSAP